MISVSVAPPFLSSRATTVAVLLPSRVPSPFAALAFFCAFAGFVAGVVFLLTLAAGDATSGTCAPTAGLGSAAPPGTEAECSPGSAGFQSGRRGAPRILAKNI
jgi:hypothetical protein